MGNLSWRLVHLFSCNQDLVPIVGSPAGVDLPYDILFKINLLVQLGCLSGPTLDNNFYRLVDPQRMIRACIEVQITPSKVYFSGPEINVSNRVLRHYYNDIDNFLRVSFVDEEMENLYSTDLSPRTSTRKTCIYERILSILSKGIVIGEKKFEFLAFSSSQLKENSLWMFASRYGLTADDIREWMGDFRQIRNVAKFAARLGQSFGSSTETLSVGRHEIEVIPDDNC
ncbi:hypothetical protein M0R45_019005 [Rubus argutus]|uniref:RNA-dependent RNA polymerase n=1 Tax=Rubus argutus TaxID=59490 RepID=A0AAW1X7V9_RUBAR